jgi:hypothetical protein
MVPISHFERILKSARPGVGIPGGTGGFVYLTLAEGFGAAGEYLVVPDMSSLRLCPYARNAASVFGWLEEKDARQGPDGQVTYKTHACLRGKVKDLMVCVDHLRSSQITVDYLMFLEKRKKMAWSSSSGSRANFTFSSPPIPYESTAIINTAKPKGSLQAYERQKF